MSLESCQCGPQGFPQSQPSLIPGSNGITIFIFSKEIAVGGNGYVFLRRLVDVRQITLLRKVDSGKRFAGTGRFCPFAVNR